MAVISGLMLPKKDSDDKIRKRVLNDNDKKYSYSFFCFFVYFYFFFITIIIIPRIIFFSQFFKYCHKKG